MRVKPDAANARETGIKAKTWKRRGMAPLTGQEMRYCQAYCQTGNQTEAYRQTWPEDRFPSSASTRLMKRPEIRLHIEAVLRRMQKMAIERSADAATLSLEIADQRLTEILGTRRRTRGEVLSRDVRQLLVQGAEEKVDDRGKFAGYALSDDLKESLEQDAGPLEDTDLIKAVDITYKRLGAYPQKAPEVAQQVNVVLYEPEWKRKRDARLLEGEPSE